MAAIPTSTQTSLRQRLTERARERWPQLAQSRSATGLASPTSTAS